MAPPSDLVSTSVNKCQQVSVYASPCLWFFIRFITVNIFHRLCAVKERDLCKIYARPLSLKEGQKKKDRYHSG